MYIVLLYFFKFIEISDFEGNVKVTLSLFFIRLMKNNVRKPSIAASNIP